MPPPSLRRHKRLESSGYAWLCFSVTYRCTWFLICCEALMKITITTPSGHIGSKLADILLNNAQAQVTVLARTARKVEHLAARGARVVAGDQLDPVAVDKAVDQADALFWAVGMDYAAENVRARYNQFAEAASDALR